MKNTIFLLILITGIILPQNLDIRGSMGINFISTPSLRDYLNQNFRTGDELSTFNSAVNFSAESNYYLSENLAAGIEVAYVLNSFTFFSDIGTRELTSIFILPSLTAYYVISGFGYNFKFGGGAGPRLSYINEVFTFYSEDHTSMGFGFLLKAEGNTLLGGDLYANIGADLRYDLNGSFTAGRLSNREVDLVSFSAGIRLGLTYFIL
jgi:hypothetical protein